MNILNLPDQIQDNILINVGGGTQLELVCKNWYFKCRSKYVKKKREPCICFKGYAFSKKCKSKEHFCMCHKGMKEIMFCKGKDTRVSVLED